MNALVLAAVIEIVVRNEVTQKEMAFSTERPAGAVERAARHPLDDIGLEVTERWSPAAGGTAWDLTFEGDAERAGHEVRITFPIPDDAQEIFAPTELGTMSLAKVPKFEATPYGANAWNSGRCYVLPLVSLLAPRRDAALTIALPPDEPIPHLAVSWSTLAGDRNLRLRLGHRALGGGRPAKLRILFYEHPADYRGALAAYARAFPAYFEPVLPRGPFEGAFWYHHIHDHPPFEEMARQGVRYIWSSFWFTHLGEYLPDEKEWKPYTYAKWWSLGRTMGDDEIRAFAREMHGHGIGTFAYFNVTEYGGAGGADGTTAEADRRIREEFSRALMKDEAGKPIPTWEGSFAMNPGSAYGYLPHLREQVRRHIERLPEIDGFCIDRLDWASLYDYGHDDGVTMIGARPVEDMATPVGAAVREVCRIAHAAGKRVLVNQFYRIEVLRDVDGYCHENDYVRGLGYLSPFRPVAAWHMRKPYRGDLLAFEAQLKRRLQWAVFPQMIAHEFPISQQPPDPEAASMLEIYAPLFAPLRGKRQVLIPHSIAVSGANDANLFEVAGRYVVPITSRVRFLSRGGGPAEKAAVTLRVPGAKALAWAHAIPAEGPSYRAGVALSDGDAKITIDRHRTATIVIAGEGDEPALPPGNVEPAAKTRASGSAPRPSIGSVRSLEIVVAGTQVGPAPDPVAPGAARTPVPCPSGELPEAPPVARISRSCEGAWLAVEKVRAIATRTDSRRFVVARWSPDRGGVSGSATDHALALDWCEPEEIIPPTARFISFDRATRGAWRGRYGSRSAWIPNTGSPDAQEGFTLAVETGAAFNWPAREGARRTTCWHAIPSVEFAVAPPDRTPYRLTLYIIDYDRNGRAMEVSIAGEFGALDTRPVTTEDSREGIYATWLVSGPVSIAVRKTAGYNAVVSGVFIDPE
ncbi:MAG: hypothetical protein JXP34_00035 [Planctomycetes bacterium]|nr:hypothetical protein [Planctomycetota bacterium]